MLKIYDTIIIGGGPAGAAAGVYAARKKLKTLLIAESFGGQSIVSDSIENWIGEINISGIELAKKLEVHVREQEEIDIKMPEKVIQTKETDGIFEVETDQGNIYEAKTLIIASGGRRRRLGIPGEDKFEGKGVSYCATCDAPLFRNKDVAVIGGGNSGLEAVIDLLPYASKVYLLNRSDELKGDQVTQEEMEKEPKVEIINNAEAKEIFGDQLVSGIEYFDRKNMKVEKIEVGGIFIEIGSVPNSEIVKDLVEINDYKEIIVDHKTRATSKAGVFAAGDVSDEIYKQNNIAVGDAIIATLSAYNYILNIKKETPAAEKHS